MPRGPRRKKALGQHHLREGALCRPILDYLFAGSEPIGADSPEVVEIGPGGGVLTAELLAAGARVLALEIDPEWAESLRSRLPTSALSIRVGDALDFDWSTVPFGTKVCGNLPYQVGTAIVERVLRAYPRVERAAFLLQREVVDRLVAGPESPDYGALSLLTQLRATASRLGIVRPGSFVPPPKVDSAFVGLRLHAPPLPETDTQAFERFVRAAFRQRRKTLVNTLGDLTSRAAVEGALARLRRDPRTRAEELGMEEQLRLFELLRATDATVSRSPDAILGAGETTGSSTKP